MTATQWLVKTEPEEFSWDDLVARPGSRWDGVRNVEARNNLRKMALGDRVLVYHTGKQRQIVGIAEVVTTAYRDPTSTRGIWSAVDVTALQPLPTPVTLATLKADASFDDCLLTRRPRLSVMPIEEKHFKAILKLGGA